MKKILPVAVLAAMAGVNGAQAVHVNTDGLGQVLVYPYYTADTGYDTYINLVNTTNTTKAVKVRFLESMNSVEVLDFNLYLSPFDHWSATVSADPNGNGAALTSADNSCTVPLAVSNGATIPFRSIAYEGDSIDGIERTLEGYVEVIEMATLVDDSENWPVAIAHVNDVPDDCQLLDSAWLPGGIWDTDPTDGTELPTGGLYGYGVLINVEEGTDATYDAVAFDNFWDPLLGGSHTDPGNLSPSLASGTDEYAVIDGASVINDFASNGLDAVSATIMHDTIANDFVLEPDIAAGTDWVMTFPTKRDYVSVDPAIAPFTDPWDPLISQSCEEFGISIWNREERQPGIDPGENDFSPRPVDPEITLALCWEANVMSWNDSNVLGATGNGRNGTNLTIELLEGEEAIDNGWARMSFVSPAARPPLVAGANSFNGLPVVGFAVQKYVNNTIEVDGETVLSNYAGAVSHKATRSISAAAP